MLQNVTNSPKGSLNWPLTPRLSLDHDLRSLEAFIIVFSLVGEPKSCTWHTFIFLWSFVILFTSVILPIHGDRIWPLILYWDHNLQGWSINLVHDITLINFEHTCFSLFELLQKIWYLTLIVTLIWAWDPKSCKWDTFHHALPFCEVWWNVLEQFWVGLEMSLPQTDPCLSAEVIADTQS